MPIFWHNQQYCIGFEVWQKSQGIFISQDKYARALLDKFKVQDYKHASTPMEFGLKLSSKFASLVEFEYAYKQLVVSLIYLTATRLDLSLVVSYISRFMTTTSDHWVAAQHILHYVKGKPNFGILYGQIKDPWLIVYTNSDLGRLCWWQKKSTSKYVLSLGTSAITWPIRSSR